MELKNYQKLAVILFLSFCIMYAVMFLNVDRADHIYLSITRFYMSMLMVCPMALLMIFSMRMMYKHKKWNAVIIISGTVVFVLSLAGLRSQTMVNDRQYMQAMIPHHSLAIMTSKHAVLNDPELKVLAASIIKSQEQEIEEMKNILERLGK